MVGERNPIARSCAKAKSGGYTKGARQHRRAPVRPAAVTTAQTIMENFIHKSVLVKTLGISTRTLENWCVHRDFPEALRVPGSRLVFFCVAEVDAWLERTLKAEAAE